jgi:uncharacterized membrane protein YdbT with pleckstrin-like domain
MTKVDLVQLDMPEIFGASKTQDIHEIVDLEKSGRFRSSIGSLVVKPSSARFESQDDDEEIIMMGRSHFITNIKWIAISSFAFFVPMFWGEFPMIKALDVNTSFVLSVVWYSVLLFYVIQNFVLWFYNVFMVTNERVVDVDIYGLLNKNINVTQISRLEDVSYSQKGIFAGFFNYGDVVVETASEQRSEGDNKEPEFGFRAISNPALVVKIISELMEKAEEEGHHK